MLIEFVSNIIQLLSFPTSLHFSAVCLSFNSFTSRTTCPSLQVKSFELHFLSDRVLYVVWKYKVTQKL